jgi:hypothetical protein
MLLLALTGAVVAAALVGTFVFGIGPRRIDQPPPGLSNAPAPVFIVDDREAP